MSDVTVRELLRHPQDHVGQQVALCGWVRTVRDVKACAFIELNDGSVVKNVQVVCGNDSQAQFQVYTAEQTAGGLVLEGALVSLADQTDLARFEATLRPRDSMFGYAITGLTLA